MHQQIGQIRLRQGTALSHARRSMSPDPYGKEGESPWDPAFPGPTDLGPALPAFLLGPRGAPRPEAERVLLERSLMHFETAREIDPLFCDVDLNLGTALFAMEDVGGAVGGFLRALDCPFAVAKAMDSLMKIWGAYAEQDPRNVTLLEQMAGVWERAEDRGAAARVLLRAAELERSGHARRYDARGLVRGVDRTADGARTTAGAGRRLAALDRADALLVRAQRLRPDACGSERAALQIERARLSGEEGDAAGETAALEAADAALEASEARPGCGAASTALRGALADLWQAAGNARLAPENAAAVGRAAAIEAARRCFARASAHLRRLPRI
jgi:hypothetical protein